MSIADIKTPWLRQAALIVVFPFLLVLSMLLGAVDEAWEYLKDRQSAWHGERWN